MNQAIAYMAKNWRTTLAGVIALLTVGLKLANGHALGADDIAVISVALGLSQAKDMNVSGGSKDNAGPS